MDHIYGISLLKCNLFLEVNIALGKPAAQSSTYRNGLSSRAVDGNTNGDFHSHSCSHLNMAEIKPW